MLAKMILDLIIGSPLRGVLQVLDFLSHRVMNHVDFR